MLMSERRTKALGKATPDYECTVICPTNPRPGSVRDSPACFEWKQFDRITSPSY